jgi:hypothetical protein
MSCALYQEVHLLDNTCIDCSKCYAQYQLNTSVLLVEGKTADRILSAKTDFIRQFQHCAVVLNQQAVVKKQHKGQLNRQALIARTFQGRQAGCNVSRSYETVPASNTAERFHQYDHTVSQFSSDTIQQYTVALFASPPREIIYPSFTGTIKAHYLIQHRKAENNEPIAKKQRNKNPTRKRPP